MERPKVGVLGWYGHQNVGDESYKLSFPKLFPQYDFAFVEKVNTPPLPVYILGGGDIVCKPLLDRLKGIAKKHILSAGMAEPCDNVTGFDVVALRDRRSIDNMAASGVKAQYCPDFAFVLDGNAERGWEIIKNRFVGRDLYQKVITVIVNGHLHLSGEGKLAEAFAFQHAAFEMARAMDSTSASFFFIPFGSSPPWDDRVTNAWVAAKCKFWQKNVVAYEALAVQETLDVIAASDAVVSTRLHSSIFACATGTPFVDLTHNHKNAGLLDSLGLSKLSLPFGGFDWMVLTRFLAQLLEEKKLKDELTEIAANQRVAIREFTKYVRLV